MTFLTAETTLAAPPPLGAECPDVGPLVAPEARPLLDGPLRPTILRLALPAVGTMLFQVLFNVTDTFWVGRTLGSTALAGVSAASYLLWIILSIGELLSVGLTAVAARRHGERAGDAAARAAGTALVLAAGISIPIAALGLGLLGPAFRLMAVEPGVAAFGRQFLVVQLLGAFPIYGYFVVDAAFRSSGDSRTPFLLLGASVILNLVLDPLMILGIGPFPRLGVYGAALATVLTRGFGFAMGIVLLARRGRIVPAFSARVAATIARIGTPTMLTGVLFSTIYVLLVRIVQPFGTPAVAALGVGHKVEGVNYMVAVGFALAAQTMVGQNLGAGNPARARAAGWTTAWITIVPLGLCSLIFLAAAAPLAGVFTTDPAVVADAALYIRIIAWSQVFMAVELVLEASMSGAGYTIWPMVWIVGLSAIRIPIAAAIAVPFGLAGVWWTLSVTAVGRGIAMATLWRWGAWGTAKA